MIKEILLSFIAGNITFISPCVLPLLPAYIFYVTGIKTDEKIEDRSKYILKILSFILGFTVVFVTLGTLTGILSFTIRNIRQYLNIIFGVLVIIFSLHFIGIINIFFLNSEKKFTFSKLPSGYIGSFLIGMAFAAGWTPCIGPVLGSILGLVASGSSIMKGVLLLFIFSLGLGIPFFFTALFFNNIKPVVDFLKRNSLIIKKISGIFLLFIGILILFGTLNKITIYILKFANFLEKTLPVSNYLFSFVLAIIGFLFLIPIFKNKKFSIPLFLVFNFFVILSILNLYNILPIMGFFIKYLNYSGL